MQTLSIRQPFAWLVVAGFKPIENRTWITHHRGPLQIHAGKKMHDMPIEEIEQRWGVKIDREALQFGGIIGRVELTDIVTRSESRWFVGPFGWVLAQPRFVPFVQMRGGQCLFDSPVS